MDGLKLRRTMKPMQFQPIKVVDAVTSWRILNETGWKRRNPSQIHWECGPKIKVPRTELEFAAVRTTNYESTPMETALLNPYSARLSNGGLATVQGASH